MGRPLFSIVTITFRNLDGLRATVDSVQSQSLRDFEHIVIDGGSTDGSVDWLAAHFDGTWVSEPDEGRYDAMNKGARMATGEYLWFMNAGDLFGDSNVLERVAAAIEREGRPDWLYGLARLVGPDKRLIGVLGVVPFSMFNFAILQRPLPHQASAFRRDFFWHLGGYEGEMEVAFDQLFMVRAANSSPPLAIADFLCDFDAAGVSADRPWWMNQRDAYEILRRCDVSVTPWRTLDKLLALGYTLLRLFGRFLRSPLRRVNAAAADTSATPARDEEAAS